MSARLHLTAPSWRDPTGPASRGFFCSDQRRNAKLAKKLSGGGAEGQAPCPAAGPALSARERRPGGAVGQELLALNTDLSVLLPDS